MVAAVGAALDHRRPAELAAPDHQRVVEQAALLQVLDQRRAGLVGVLAILLEIRHEVAVLVPRLVEQLDEPDAPLDQPAGEQAVVGERRLAWLGAVHVEDVLRLLGDVHELRGARLHPERHLERVDAGGDLGVADGVEPDLVQAVDRVERVALQRRRRRPWGSRGRGPGSPPRAELDALMDGRQEAAAPVRIAAAGPLAARAEDDEARGGPRISEPRP